MEEIEELKIKDEITSFLSSASYKHIIAFLNFKTQLKKIDNIGLILFFDK